MSETVDPLYVRDVVHQVDVMAERLEKLAERLRLRAKAFANPHVNAVGLAADLVSDYTQGVGSQGTYLWGLVTDARTLDAGRAKQS